MIIANQIMIVLLLLQRKLQRIVVDSLQGIVNTEARIAYDNYLMERKKNNTS